MRRSKFGSKRKGDSTATAVNVTALITGRRINRQEARASGKIGRRSRVKHKRWTGDRAGAGGARKGTCGSEARGQSARARARRGRAHRGRGLFVKHISCLFIIRAYDVALEANEMSCG